MKADKLLFGAACLGMAYMINTTANHSSCCGTPQSTVLADTINKRAVSHELAKDTISFTKAAKDSMKVMQKVIK